MRMIGPKKPAKYASGHGKQHGTYQRHDNPKRLTRSWQESKY